jgi:hypothetical protein
VINSECWRVTHQTHRLIKGLNGTQDQTLVITENEEILNPCSDDFTRAEEERCWTLDELLRPERLLPILVV